MKEAIDRTLVDPSVEVGVCQDGLDLGAEAEAVSRASEVERLDTDAIARQHEALSVPIPDGEADHPATKLSPYSS